MTRFIDHLYTQLITASNYNSLTGLHTLKITVTAAHIVFYVFISHFLATNSNSVLCLRPYRLTNIPQMAKPSNCLGYNISAPTT
jgi:hypothetical protein